MSYIQASMAGNVWKVVVSVGDQVEQGQEVAILESMKMEIPIESEVAGTVKAILKPEGEFVNEGDHLIELD
ncbi:MULTISPECIES: acetyl-CoA carboxylase biotin carboxyl carrier protein subunit [Shouchella]|uniref:Biotin/lipoyl attachment protein n=2 Tax=Bacillaceae TaxID=186817 RepID=A0A060LVU0_9BACI|nr:MULTISPECIES: acetyl-CoA carboxylase biotin carboxyl carrier protein subunit [Bacillaceae]AIC93905.1 biotin/lipoyl attachment protein [Shouchella lehensis G1]KQL55850.1 biotin/lipoyl attachment protein [Alkalicoccobacillus plakortidis]RQW19762.1 acetyl-CoA carboxylase biotin carboxyl carrier protein subunit [Bacillus sp. C1-1]